MVARWLLLVALAAGVALLAWTGCSCRESEPTEEVVRVQGAAPQGGQDEQAQPAAGQQAAPQGQAAAQAPERRRGESVLQAPGDYMYGVTVTAPRQARKTLDTAYIQNEINDFNAIEGRYPKSLDELVQWRGAPLPDTPSGYVYKYDPATGKLEVVPGGAR